jgi:hypothetical protein
VHSEQCIDIANKRQETPGPKYDGLPFVIGSGPAVVGIR